MVGEQREKKGGAKVVAPLTMTLRSRRVPGRQPQLHSANTTDSGTQAQEAYLPPTMTDMPNEMVCEILARTDGHTVACAMRVCKTWRDIITDTLKTPGTYDKLPKAPSSLALSNNRLRYDCQVAWKTVTVSAQRGLEMTLEKHPDDAVPGAVEGSEEAADLAEDGFEPAAKRHKLQASYSCVSSQNMEKSGLWITKQKRPSLTRTLQRHTFKITDRLGTEEMPHLLKYFRCISPEKLVLQSLSGKGLLTFLMIFRRLCIRNTSLALEFCTFANVPKNLVIAFLKPRQGRLREIQLASCRDLDKCIKPEEFWTALEPLQGPFPTVRLRDHYSDSPWSDALAAILLRLPSPPWMVDMDGINVEMGTVHQALVSWYAGDPCLAPRFAKNRRPKTEEQAWLETQLRLGQQTWPMSTVLRIDNSRQIRLGRFWNETQRRVLEPYQIQIQPDLSKVLEPCFDGKWRYSSHRNRMVLKRPDGARMHIYLQR